VVLNFGVVKSITSDVYTRRGRGARANAVGSGDRAMGGGGNDVGTGGGSDAGIGGGAALLLGARCVDGGDSDVGVDVAVPLGDDAGDDVHAPKISVFT
jgi:hypothetical protein